jgi:argininosuccinate lyase
MLRLLAGFTAAVRIDQTAVRRLIDASCITITELADSLVRAEGLSFREAHEVAARVSRAVIAQGGGLSGLGFESFARLFAEATGRETKVTAQDFTRFVSPEHFVAVRERPGGPGPKALAASLARYRAAADRQAAHLAARRGRRDAAAAERRRLADALIAQVA